MVLAFLMSIDFTFLTVLGIPSMLAVFLLSRKLLKKKSGLGSGGVLLWSLLATIILSPIVAALVAALLMLGFTIFANDYRL